jgi:hypothetical protein
MNIDEDILKKTTQCKKGFSCLSSKTRTICDVRSKLESYEGEMILFCEPRNGEPCDYKRPFGDFCVCECPTRKEIYTRYQV